MSQGSYSSHRRCRCGIVANHFTAWTPSNAGRRFFKCARNGSDSCGYWEWDDDIFSDRAVIVIRNLKLQLESVCAQRDKLNTKVDVMEKKAKNQENKLIQLKMCIIISWAMFIGFIAALLMK